MPQPKSTAKPDSIQPPQNRWLRLTCRIVLAWFSLQSLVAPSPASPRKNDLSLQAASNTAAQRSTNTGSSASIGFGINFGSQSGISLNASASQSRGNADGQDMVQGNTHVTAGTTQPA